MRKRVHSICRRHGLGDVEADLVETAVAEACHNALRHGSEEKKPPHCYLEISFDEKAVKAVLIDWGEAYDFDGIEPFSIDQDFMVYEKGGLGIPLMKALMDEVRYERQSDNTNKLTLIKYLTVQPKKGGN